MLRNAMKDTKTFLFLLGEEREGPPPWLDIVSAQAPSKRSGRETEGW